MGNDVAVQNGEKRGRSTSGLRAHPAAQIFPLMGEAELQELADDIKEHGQQEPIVLLDRQILDGRNRYAACALAGVTPLTREHDGKTSPTEYVVSKNIKRRHLTPAQRAALGAEITPLYEAEAKARKIEGGKSGGRGRVTQKDRDDPSLTYRDKQQDESARSIARAAKAAGAGVKATQALKAVLEDAPAVHGLAKADKVTIAQAKQLAALPSKEREKAVDEILGGAKPAAVLRAGVEGPHRGAALFAAQMKELSRHCRAVSVVGGRAIQSAHDAGVVHLEGAEADLFLTEIMLAVGTLQDVVHLFKGGDVA